MRTAAPSALAPSAALRPARCRCRALAVRCAALPSGSHSQLGSSRKQNEDRYVTQQLTLSGLTTGPADYYGVFDGHGGSATSDWLAANLGGLISAGFDARNPAAALEAVFLKADDVLLAPQGFLGMGARGIGGPKCGSTGLVVLVYTDPAGTRQLVSANVGDARCVYVDASGAPTQLSVDHVPDDEAERYRIELRNPNPKKPLVRFVGSCWRVGGLLALSRAFGDAHLKASGEFEGYGGANDDYSSGFGVIASPHVAAQALPAGGWLVLSSDGLYDNDVRGGGGGLQLAEVGAFVAEHSSEEPGRLAAMLSEYALAKGSTDDITVTVVRLPPA